MRTSVVLAVFLGVVRTVHGDCDRPTGGANTELITDVTFPASDGTSVYFTCEVGYQREGGSGTVTCSGGTWSRLKMRCTIRNCGSAGEVINGRVEYSEGTDFGATARVVCNEGYIVVAFENRLVCGVNGWQGRLATCEVITCDAPNPIADGYFSPVKDDYEHSEVITYGCEGRHELNGSKTATCQDNGQFHPAPPTCVLMSCPEPRVANGELASVTFRCAAGHRMEGQGTVTCDSNSNWSPALPKCNLVNCPEPSVMVSNAVVAGGARPPYIHQSSVTFRCAAGHRMEGQATVTCDINSKWGPALPKCNLIECKAPKVTNGEVVGIAHPTYRYEETVTLMCEKGYVLIGQSTLMCKDMDQWSAAPPTCIQHKDLDGF